MRVVHVMTYAHGGAGIAALRIHQALRQHAACNSTVLCLSARTTSGDVQVVAKHFDRFWERGAARAGLPLSLADKDRARREEMDLGDIPFSSPTSDYDILAHPLVAAADIIHLHWVGGFLDWESFFKRATKPIVWTMHDMNPFLGGFHYEGDAARATPSARVYDADLVRRKADYVAQCRSLHIVGPSRWIHDRSLASAVLGQFNHSVIPYPTDPLPFRPRSRDAARDLFDIRLDARVLLTVAEKAADPRKGADLLRDALCEGPISQRWYWASVGEPAGMDGTDAHSLGSIDDPRMMSMAYSLADLVVVPSREDNLPNVVIESLTCGTPVVALPVGGLPEMIQGPVDGLVATSASASGLVQAIRGSESITFDRAAIRARALEKYDPAKVAGQYFEIYRKILTL